MSFYLLSVVVDVTQQVFKHAYVHRALLVGSIADGIHQLPSYLSEIKNINKEEKEGQRGKGRFLCSGWLKREAKRSEGCPWARVFCKTAGGFLSFTSLFSYYIIYQDLLKFLLFFPAHDVISICECMYYQVQVLHVGWW